MTDQRSTSAEATKIDYSKTNRRINTTHDFAKDLIKMANGKEVTPRQTKLGTTTNKQFIFNNLLKKANSKRQESIFYDRRKIGRDDEKHTSTFHLNNS